MMTALRCLSVALTILLAGCQTTRPPRVLDLPKKSSPSEYHAAVGTISVSTPMFTRITHQPKDGDRIDFGEMKDEKSIRDQIRSANMGRSLLAYEAISAGMSANVAGTQIESSQGTSTSGGVKGSANLAALLALAMKHDTEQSAAPAVPDLSADFSHSGTSSYTETFKSPDVPEAPSDAEVPDKVFDKLVELLGPGGGAFTHDPRQEASLMASTKLTMNALEGFYNHAALHNFTFKQNDKEEKWEPYQALFSVSIDPGWYTYLQQHDAVLDLDFSPYDHSGYEPAVQVLNVSPAETAQTVDELNASLGQLATSLNVAGGFSAVAVNANLETVNALAQRLQGFRKQTNVIVSYPSPGMVRIRVRPSVIPNFQLAETQPTNIVFSSTLLVNKDTLQPKPSSRFGTWKEEVRGPLRAADQPSPNEVSNSQASHKAFIGYRAVFEPQLTLKMKGFTAAKRAPYFHGPDKDERTPLLAMGGRGDVQFLSGLLPDAPKKQDKKFGLAQNPDGYYDSAASNRVNGFIRLNIRNPHGKAVSCRVDDGAIISLGNAKEIVTTVKASNLSYPAGMPYGATVRALVKVWHGTAADSQVAVVNLVPRVMPAPSNQEFIMNDDGLTVRGTRIGPVNPNVTVKGHYGKK